MKKDKCWEIVRQDDEVISPSSRVPYYPLVIKKGHDAIVEDMDGNEYIDLLSSAGALNTGHSHPKVVEAIIRQVKEFIHYTPAYMYHEPLVKLAKRLCEITPGNFKKRVAFGLSGSDANDGMIKLARAYTGRKKVISFLQSYHGSTYGAISLSAISLNMRRKIGPLLPEVHHIPYPDCYRCPFGKSEESCSLECLKQLESAFSSYIPPEEVAAVIMEPIAGDAGLVVPPRKYLDNLYRLCKEHGILFVSEEVQQGFGRTGRWFGIEHFGIEPDAIVMGKSIASGMPLSAIVAKEEIMQAWEAPAHLFTTAGSPVSCVAALATLRYFEEGLLEHTRNIGSYALDRLCKLKDKYELIGDVRGLGLSIGVDLVKDRATRKRQGKRPPKFATVLGEGLSYLLCRQCEDSAASDFQGQMDKAIDIIEQAIMEYLAGDIPDRVLQIAKGW